MEMVEVTTGLSNDEYIEIASGLNEGDLVFVPTNFSSSNNMPIMMWPMPGPGVAPGGRDRELDQEVADSRRGGTIC